MSSNNPVNEKQFIDNFLNHINAKNDKNALNDLYTKYCINQNKYNLDAMQKLFQYIRTQDICIDGVYVDRHHNIQLNCDEWMLNLAKLVLNCYIPSNEETYRILVDAQNNPNNITPVIELIEQSQKNQSLYFYLTMSLTYSIPIILISAILTSHQALLIPAIVISAIIAIGTVFYTKNHLNNKDNLNHLKSFFENDSSAINTNSSVSAAIK